MKSRQHRRVSAPTRPTSGALAACSWFGVDAVRFADASALFKTCTLTGKDSSAGAVSDWEQVLAGIPRPQPDGLVLHFNFRSLGSALGAARMASNLTPREEESAYD
jgi:hypothetical protein